MVAAALSNPQRTRAYYRVNATRHLVGGKKVDGHDHGHEGAAKSSNGVTKLGEDHTGDDQEHHDAPFIEFESAKSLLREPTCRGQPVNL